MIYKQIKQLKLEELKLNEYVKFKGIKMFSLIKTITIDHGIVFINHKVNEYVKSRGITMFTLTPYYTQANGQVKVANKLVISLIKKHVGQYLKNWHHMLSNALWVIYNSPKKIDSYDTL